MAVGFNGEDFTQRAPCIAALTKHIPPARVHLVRYYGLYSSRGRGLWKNMLYNDVGHAEYSPLSPGRAAPRSFCSHRQVPDLFPSVYMYCQVFLSGGGE